jgi:hypothetical protein
MKHELVESELGAGADELVELVERRNDRLGRRPQEGPADTRRVAVRVATGLVEEGELSSGVPRPRPVGPMVTQWRP